MKTLRYEAVGNSVVAVGEQKGGYGTPDRAMVCLCLSFPDENGLMIRGAEMAQRIAFFLNAAPMEVISQLTFHLEPYSSRQFTHECVYCGGTGGHREGCLIGTARNLISEYKNIEEEENGCQSGQQKGVANHSGGGTEDG